MLIQANAITPLTVDVYLEFSYHTAYGVIQSWIYDSQRNASATIRLKGYLNVLNINIPLDLAQTYTPQMIISQNRPTFPTIPFAPSVVPTIPPIPPIPTIPFAPFF